MNNVYFTEVSGLWQETNKEYYKISTLPKFTVYMSSIEGLNTDKRIICENIRGHVVGHKLIESALNTKIINIEDV